METRPNERVIILNVDSDRFAGVLSNSSNGKALT